MHNLSECNRSELLSILRVVKVSKNWFSLEDTASVEDKRRGKTLKMKREMDSQVLFFWGGPEAFWEKKDMV